MTDCSKFEALSSSLLVLHADDDVALEHLDATSEPVFLRILIPLIEDVEFLVGRWFEILHAGIDGDGTGAAGAVEATGLHFHAGFLARIQKKRAGLDFGGLAARHDSDFGHNEKSGRSRHENIIADGTKTMRLIKRTVCC